MYRRRIFYDLATGEVLRSYAMQGDIKSDYTAEMECAELGFTNCGYMEWTTPDATLDAALAPVDAEGNMRYVHLSVDILAEPHALVFNYEPVPEPPPVDDLSQVIDILTGVTG